MTICWPDGGWDIISAQIQATNVPDNYFSLLQCIEPSYVLWLILPMFIYTFGWMWKNTIWSFVEITIKFLWILLLYRR
jgi:hypothetical protein